MLFNFIKWVFSWWQPTQLSITENPTTYLISKLEKPSEMKSLYLRKGTLYYNLCPPAYDAKIQVDQDMSNITLDNNISCIRWIVYDDERPIWPKFIGEQPRERWSTSYLLYLSQLS
jgi:hypothetical protein